jgi:hypothetical protein
MDSPIRKFPFSVFGKAVIFSRDENAGDRICKNKDRYKDRALKTRLLKWGMFRITPR